MNNIGIWASYDDPIEALTSHMRANAEIEAEHIAKHGYDETAKWMHKYNTLLKRCLELEQQLADAKSMERK